MMHSNSLWRKVVAALLASERVAITAHIDPDPDSLGSCLALWHALMAMGKQVQVVLSDQVPRYLRFLPGACEVVSLGRDQKNLLAEGRAYDTLVVLDCEPGRTGGILPDDLLGMTVVNVDHHVSNRAEAAARVVKPDAAATAELIAELLEVLRVELNPDSASCLLAGLVGDTGSFAYSSTSPNTHRLAARLLEAGASTEQIHQELFETVPFGFTQVLCQVLQHLHRSDDGGVAWIEIPQQLASQMKAQDLDSEGIIRYARMIEGVEVAALIREIETGQTKVSLRSRGEVDVSKIAEALGGGGHRKAAGCTVSGKLCEAKDRVLKEIGQALRQS